MDNNEIIERLKKSDLTDISNANMLFEMAINTNDRELNEYVYTLSVEELRKGNNAFYDLYKKTLLYAAPYDFDKYLIYLEFNRNAKDRFYLPRRKVLKQVVDALQDLTDDKLDEMFFSCPPRIGKTTLLMFYTTWLLGRDAEMTNLYSAYSDIITSKFYQGILEVIGDKVTYTWHEIFPHSKVVSTNANDETIDLNRKKRYPSLTCRSLYGTLNGACDCNGILISDDLIGGIEEALNQDRMMSAWGKVQNNLVTRAKENAKILWCGTRWSLVDPAGMRQELVLNSPQFADRRVKVINIPALDENDESNFDYDYGVGFSTEKYRQVRAGFERGDDMASWSAQYMCTPIEREGTLFHPDNMRFFNGEVMGEPDRVIMAVDPSFGGGDYTAAPIVYQYGDELYVVDVVFSTGEKTITQPEIADKIMKYGVRNVQIEVTKATMPYKEGIIDILKKNNYKCMVTSKAASSNTHKENRIFDCAPEIRDMYFIEEGKRSKEYSLFMQNVFSFKMIGKNKHDDAPDSLSMLCSMLRSGQKKVSVMKRFF